MDALDAFDQHLVIHTPVSDRHRPHYLRWVRRFVSKYGEVEPAERQKTLLMYRQELAPRFHGWQVEQALQAVRHYWHFLDRDARVKTVRKRGLDDARIIDEYRRILRLQHKSFRTEKSYMGWIQRFLTDMGPMRRDEIGADHVRHFLSYLAVERRVAVSTQEQALNALLFLCRHVLHVEIDGLSTTIRSRKPRRLPVVLTRAETGRLILSLGGRYRLMAQIMYGGGLRLEECLGLRVVDVDLELSTITVRAGKGNKDRLTVLPKSLHADLENRVQRTKLEFELGRSKNQAGVFLPDTIAHKRPSAAGEWGWYWLFPASRVSVHPQTGQPGLYHLHASAFARALTEAVRASGLKKRVTAHVFRHSFATHLIETGYDIRTVQELLGHSRVQTTMVYTHVARNRRLDVISPLDRPSSSRDSARQGS